MSRSYDRRTKLISMMLVGTLVAVVAVSAATAVSGNGFTQAAGQRGAEAGRLPSTEEIRELESQIEAATQADETDDLASESGGSRAPTDAPSELAEIEAQLAAEGRSLEPDLDADVDELQEEVDAQGRELEAQSDSSSADLDIPSAEEIRRLQQQTGQ